MLPLYFSAIDRWAERHGVDGYGFRLLKASLQSMDAVFCKFMNDWLKAEAKTARERARRGD